MSRFNRVILAIAGGCLALGILICVIVGATGGWNVFLNAANRRWEWEWSWGEDGDNSSVKNAEDSNSYSANNRGEYTNVNKIFSDEGIRSIEITIPYGEVNLETGDSFSVDAENVLSNTLTAEVKDDVLILQQKLDRTEWNIFGFDIYGIGEWNDDFKTSKIIITVPKDFKAEDFKLDFGAGKAEISDISAEYAFIDVGAGDVQISNFSADKIEVNIGAGNLTMEDVDLNDLDLDAGVGNTEIEGTITGKNKLDCGVGLIQLDLDGDIDDYDFDVDHGVGTVRINGEKIESKHTNSAKHSFSISGGVGNVTINIE